MLTFSLPSFSVSETSYALQAQAPYSYPHVGATQSGIVLPGFDHDRLRLVIGHSAADFQQAKEAIRQWQMFPRPWTRILPQAAPITPGSTVLMFARVSGLWWRNACRVVYAIDEPGRFGFAYGTLPGHVECGEELFWVGMEADGSVWYEIRAFSRPRHWLARLGYPLVRYLQGKFRRDSARQMRAFIQNYRVA